MKIKALVFLSIAIFLTIIWFASGKTIAGGEEAFSVFNDRSIATQTAIWQETGAGFLWPPYQTRLFPILFVKLLQLFSLPLFIIQGVFFASMLWLGLFASYMLTQYLIKDHAQKKTIAVVAALFYLFNTYTQSQIIGRFLYAAIVTWAYIPLFIFLWLQWINEKKYKSLAVLLITSVIFSIPFIQPASFFVFFLPIGIYVLVKVIGYKKDWKQTLSLLSRCIVAFVLWIAINGWWIIPYVKLNAATFSNIKNNEVNYDSLLGVSQYFPSSQILTLRQSFLFNESFYNGWYLNPYISILVWSIFALMVVGMVTSRKYKNWKYLVGLLIITWFMSKGTNPPLGIFFYKTLFNTVAATQSLRNSYEKLGVLFILPYAIFFALGAVWIYQRIPKLRIKIIATSITGVLCFGVLVWPFWTGDIFGAQSGNMRNTIPSYYHQANAYLEQQQNDGRILMLPILPGDGVSFNWPDGQYNGVEPSEFLFSRPSVSKILRNAEYDKIYLALHEAFRGNKQNEFKKYLEELNIRYLILHHDLVEKSGGTITDTETEEILATYPELRIIKTYGKLDIYEYPLTHRYNLFSVEGEKTPEISYTKINPTHYKVKVTNATNPYILTFKQSFSSFWYAKIESEKISDHQHAYSYANQWNIKKTGSYEIDIAISP